MTIHEDARIGLINAQATDERQLLLKAETSLQGEGADGSDIDWSAVLRSSDVLLRFSAEVEDNALYYTVQQYANAAEMLPGLYTAPFLDRIYEDRANNINADDAGVALLSRTAAFEDYGFDDAASAVKATNQLTELAVSSGIYNAALDAHKLVTRSVERRTSVTERGPEDGLDLWVDVAGTTNRAKTLYGASGYDLDLAGTIFGADIEAIYVLRIGAAVTVGTGTAHARNAAFRTKNSADFVGVTLYARETVGDINLRADLGWIHTKSDISGTSSYGMNFDQSISADAYTVGLSGEWLIDAGAFKLIPHVGLRWTHLKVDGYDRPFRTDAETMDIVTMPVGVTLEGSAELSG